MATRKKSKAVSGVYRAAAARTPRVAEPALAIRRKNFDLDQNRLDQLRVALGAKTEREAIVSAMDIALDVLAFEHELQAGADAMFGNGGFQNVFDRADALEFGGFAPAARRTGR